jgi:hypothetical protein
LGTWGISAINIGESENQLAWGKRKFVREKRGVIIDLFWDRREMRARIGRNTYRFLWEFCGSRKMHE